MAGYIGSKAAVTQVDGYTKSEADARYVEGDDTLYVDQANNRVGISTSSPDLALDVSHNTTAEYVATFQNTADNLELKIGTTTGGLLNIQGANASNNNAYDFSLNADGGNVMVGKSSVGAATAGFETRSSGYTAITRDGGQPLEIRRLTSNGQLIDLRKDSTSVGAITVLDGERISIHSGTVGVEFNPSNQVNPSSGSGGVDNTLDLGASGARWDDIYATNGTIQTSDRNEKQDIAELTEAEQRVAVAAKGLLRKFRWKSAVAEKGDNARTHFGIIAQDLQAAFEAEGLDAGKYAMFISSTWTDEETGEERTRLGVRYSELLAFIIGAL